MAGNHAIPKDAHHLIMNPLHPRIVLSAPALVSPLFPVPALVSSLTPSHRPRQVDVLDLSCHDTSVKKVRSIDIDINKWIQESVMPAGCIQAAVAELVCHYFNGLEKLHRNPYTVRTRYLQVDSGIDDGVLIIPYDTDTWPLLTQLKVRGKMYDCDKGTCVLNPDEHDWFTTPMSTSPHPPTRYPPTQAPHVYDLSTTGYNSTTTILITLVTLILVLMCTVASVYLTIKICKKRRAPEPSPDEDGEQHENENELNDCWWKRFKGRMGQFKLRVTQLRKKPNESQGQGQGASIEENIEMEVKGKGEEKSPQTVMEPCNDSDLPPESHPSTRHDPDSLCSRPFCSHCQAKSDEIDDDGSHIYTPEPRSRPQPRPKSSSTPIYPPKLDDCDEIEELSPINPRTPPATTTTVGGDVQASPTNPRVVAETHAPINPRVSAARTITTVAEIHQTTPKSVYANVGTQTDGDGLNPQPADARDLIELESQKPPAPPTPRNRHIKALAYLMGEEDSIMEHGEDDEPDKTEDTRYYESDGSTWPAKEQTTDGEIEFNEKND